MLSVLVNHLHMIRIYDIILEYVIADYLKRFI